ncbi:Fc.00g046090.m01.CDS01 [Cosmosporella sp. VM-42]
MDTNECKKCDYDSIVWQFALRLQERGIVTGQISKKLDKADRVRGDMRNGKGLDYQTLRELNRPELTTMTESEYTDSASANSDNERGHPLNYPPPGRFQNQAPSKVRFAKPYGPEDVQYSGYYPRSNAPRPTEPPRYRDVTCSWCSAEHRKPMNVHSDVLGPYDTCRKCGIILICQDCRRPITKSFLCECPTFQGNNTSYAAPKAENRRVSPISDEDDHRSDIRNRRNDGPSNSRAHRRDGGNKAQKAAMASLIAGATEAFRTRNEPAGGRTKRVLAAAAGAAAADNLITRDTGSAYSYSDRESSYDDDSDYQKTRPYAPKDTSDRLAHFSGETTPGAKLRGMRSRDIETWRHSL